MPEKPRKRVSVIEVNKKAIIETNKINFEENPDEKSKGPRFGCRHVQGLILCIGLICGISTRTNISVAIVAMTNNTTSPNPEVPTYNWNNTSVILSSFFWSYISLQIVAGYLGKTYGPKYFLLITSFINSCACALTPLAAAKIGSVGVILCRVVQGFSQGFLYPSVHAMLGMWIPDEERSTMSNFVFSGIGLGSMYASILTGYVSASWWGWEYSFYILASMGFLWCILWGLLGQNNPASHLSITEEEKRYIQNALKQEDDVHIPIPWKKILTSVPFYALMAGFVGNAWGYTIMNTEIATYLANVLNFDMKSNAIINAIPTLFGIICSYITGPLSDWLIVNKYVSTINSRRFFQVVGSLGQGACLVWLSYLSDANTYKAVAILSIANAFAAFVLVGYGVNHLDLSPRFAGVMFGLLNAAAQAAAIIAPLAAQYIVTDLTNIAQWRIVFIISIVFYGVGSFLFSIFGSATRQSWDGPENKILEEKRKKISVISFTGI